MVITESEAWDLHGNDRGTDEGDWFGAFYVPRNEPALIDTTPVTSGPQRRGCEAEENTQEQMQNCISCGTPTRDMRQLACGHLWGRTCLFAMVELAMQWEGNFPAKCCQKIEDIEMKDLAPFLGEGIVQRYLDKSEEVEAPRDQRIYCANHRCSAFLGQRGPGVHLDSCRKCNTSTCLACGEEERLHDHDQCPPERIKVSHNELIRSGKLQQCPGCPEVVELKEACNHIT